MKGRAFITLRANWLPEKLKPTGAAFMPIMV
jgi:hypothetical protein